MAAETTRSSVRFRIGTGDTERDRIRAFVRAQPDRHVHVLDLPYRLASPAYAASETAVWETADGALAAFAVWQPAFKMLDYGIDPGHDLGDSVIDWIDVLFGQRARAGTEPVTCWIKVSAANRQLIPQLERRGFTRCAWSIVHLQRPVERWPPPALPPGFSMRAGNEVASESWAALHRAVFPRVGMSAEWRRGIIESTDYSSDLDILAVAPDGSAAAFCAAWAGELHGERVAEIEPLGTGPNCRGMRLGRTLLQELLRRLAAGGVSRVFVEPWDDNHEALHAYQSMGFSPAFKIPTFAKRYA